MDFTCHVVLIETSGNQTFIFDTTKRRENVGASELIYRLEQWVRDALAEEFTGFDRGWRIADNRPAQLLVNAAGNAKIVVRDPEQGRALVGRVTARALREAPGLDVCGVVGEPFDWAGVHEEVGKPPVSMLARACREVHESLPAVRNDRPGPMNRFPRIPIVDECAASGLPAYDVVVDGDGARSRQPRSRPSLAKYDARDDGFHRLACHAGISKDTLKKIADHLDDKPDWVAVIHADGNSLGQLITELGGGSDDNSGSETPGNGGVNTLSDRYAGALRPFSEAVQECTVTAFQKALEHCRRVLPRRHDVNGAVPVLPLVLGGDDLTVICTGSVALAFTEAYLTAFEEETRGNKVIGRTAPDGLTACAGVAVVKPHFPFSAAYELAEELTREAKKAVKRYSLADGPADSSADGSQPGDARTTDAPEHPRPRPRASAFSFHVLYDSGGSDPAHLRDRMKVPPGAADLTAEPDPEKQRELRALLYAQPYVVTPRPRLGDAPWTRGRHWNDLLRRTAALTDTLEATNGPDEAGDRKLPASQMNDLREALFSGRDVADSRFRQLLRHYRDRGLDLFTADGAPDGGAHSPDTASLFWRVRDRGLIDGRPADITEPPVTALLDAMNAVHLMGDLPDRHNRETRNPQTPASRTRATREAAV